MRKQFAYVQYESSKGTVVWHFTVKDTCCGQNSYLRQKGKQECIMKQMTNELTSTIILQLLQGPIWPNNSKMRASVTSLHRFPTYLDSRKKTMDKGHKQYQLLFCGVVSERQFGHLVWVLKQEQAFPPTITMVTIWKYSLGDKHHLKAFSDCISLRHMSVHCYM